MRQDTDPAFLFYGAHHLAGNAINAFVTGISYVPPDPLPGYFSFIDLSGHFFP